jgi:hypothetical protein
LSAVEVSRLLQAPKSQDFVFYAPIQQTNINNSYIFYNVQQILAYRGNNVQVKYRLGERDDQAHTQWMFFRQGDTSSTVTSQYWDKFVDSICGYTQVLPVSDEYSNSIMVYKEIPTAWDNFAWDTAEWDISVENNAEYYGEILPVPDPSLSEAEKYGIDYRPRQGMFVNLQAARKVFVQSANELLKYIPVRDDNPGWDANVSTSIYWAYTNWYKPGYEDVLPTSSYSTLAEATSALDAGQLQVNDILQVIDGTPDKRFVLYAVVQLNPNIAALSLEEVCIERSAIKLLDTVYTSVNRYDLSVELRQLLNAFRTEVMVDENLVDQNELFFSMLNFVVSEQKNPSWLFKSSYIYIKEKNVPLTEKQLYVPDQINNIVNYIKDVKPYHTQIRDYSTQYTYADVAAGTASDRYLVNPTLSFGPRPIVEIEPSAVKLDALTFASILNQYVAGSSNFDLNTVSVDITTPDPGKKGFSALYPYTVAYSDFTSGGPQTFVAPESILAVNADGTYLLYGHDYYVVANDNQTYTLYFYNDPSGYSSLQALIFFGGSSFQNITFNTASNETALGFPVDNTVVNVDTKFTANDVSEVVDAPWSPATLAPLVGWGTSWDSINDPVVASILTDAGGITDVPWDTPVTPVILEPTISYRENNNSQYQQIYMRNGTISRATLTADLPAPTAETENLGVIEASAADDIFPNPENSVGVVWIGGERIEYRSKRLISAGVWELGLLRRGTENTSAVSHTVLIPSASDPLIMVPNSVWVENGNKMPSGSDAAVWQATNSSPDLSTQQAPGQFTSVTGAPMGGLWYSITPQAQYLKQSPGNSME